MIYCYHCTARLSKDYKVCPHCNKTLDLEMLKRIFHTDTGGDSKGFAALRIWFWEHNRILMPTILFLFGMGVGFPVWWGYAQVRITAALSQSETQIVSLQSKVADIENQQEKDRERFEAQLAQKDSAITLVASQKETLTKLINLTRRMILSAEIIPNSQDDTDFYRRNTLYLISVFSEQEEALAAAGYRSNKSYDLQTIPALLIEQTANLVR